MMKTRHLMIMLVVAMTSTAAHSEPRKAATAARTAAPVTVYVNARVHTGDEDLPRARAFVTRGDRFAFVGSAGDALRYAAGEDGVVDLQGRLGENAPLRKKHGAVRANGVRKPPERKREITQANPAG